jgi:L-glyceraldehyde 3-phosphate reductase
LASPLNCWVDEDLLDTLQAECVACIAFSPLAPGLLTSTRWKVTSTSGKGPRPITGLEGTSHMHWQVIMYMMIIYKND